MAGELWGCGRYVHNITSSTCRSRLRYKNHPKGKEMTKFIWVFVTWILIDGEYTDIKERGDYDTKAECMEQTSEWLENDEHNKFECVQIQE